jgi:hypothetical protein
MSPDNRQYIINGRKYARISDIAKAGDNPFLKEWRQRIGEAEADRIAKDAAEYGDLVHEITMWDDMGAKKKVQMWLRKHPFLAPTLFAWRKWVSTYIKEWILIEQIVWSDKWRCAGKIDRVGIIIGDPDPSIIDLKTGGMWDTIGVQLAGYLKVYNIMVANGLLDYPRGRKAQRRLAISLPRKDPGKLTLKEYSEYKFIEEFESKAELFRSMNTGR